MLWHKLASKSAEEVDRDIDAKTLELNGKQRSKVNTVDIAEAPNVKLNEAAIQAANAANGYSGL